jgi:hypothetical protein
MIKLLSLMIEKMLQNREKRETPQGDFVFCLISLKKGIGSPAGNQ